MSTLVLFGAGASAFSEDCSPRLPPLGGALFDELACQGKITQAVESDLASIFRENFEEGMAAFRQRHEVLTTSFILAMAEYFAQFEPGPENLYIKLLAALPRCHVACATLNYDLLIELSANRVGLNVSYTNVNVPPRNLPILKLHGSCNFLPDLTPRQIFNIGFDLSAGGPGSSILEAPIRIANAAEVVQFCRRENAVAPALSLYARGKATLFCPAFVLRQQEEFAEAARRAVQTFVIGVNVNENDEHVWEPLARSEGWLFYVGPDASRFLEWSKKRRRRRAAHFADSFASAIPLLLRRLSRS